MKTMKRSRLADFLPEKQYRYHYSTMSGKQREAYDTLLEGYLNQAEEITIRVDSLDEAWSIRRALCYGVPETVADYLEGVEWLREHGFKIYGVVCDGSMGLIKALYIRYPVQMCQFHQVMIVRRYLTQDPDLEAARELLRLVNSIAQMDKESFIGAFNEWHSKYKDVLNERTTDKRYETPPYMRPRLRSAYLSVKRYMPWLWTWYNYTDRYIPNTNNGVEGVFSDIKSKTRVHSGMRKEQRKKLIDEYISSLLGTAAGIYDLRRLQIKRCGELAQRALLALDCYPPHPTF